MKFYAFASSEIDPDFVSKEIMETIGAPYSHCGVIAEEDDSETIYHATGKGFHSQDIPSFLAEGKQFVHKFEMKLTVHPEFALGYLEGNIGKEYSESQYLGFINKRFEKLVENGAEKLICSEALTLFALKCCGLQKSNLTEGTDFIDPKEAIELARLVAK